jgi:alcohol dehydrogenase class IV
MLPIVAIPTTFAGSEATDVWGITEAARKSTGSDARVLPHSIVYDATLTAGLPARSAIASGLNAVAHAVDGLWAPRADPINRATGTDALRILVPALRGIKVDSEDLAAREQALLGCYLAAVAFASAGSGMHHKICHTLGGAFNLPHAEMHATVLPYVMAFNAPAAPDANDSVAAVFSNHDAAAGLDRFRRELGMPAGLRDIGLTAADVGSAAELSLPAIPSSNPRQVTLDDLKKLLVDAWAGTPVTERRSA